ncbi:PREDICTED: uncharacterized protein LOC105556809 [Vollenhovia emeryi]|uniref:uncharacterized protein LOC105556809 n=1 Tax=Vollenhovia emeryi TaxID=411798 RepID=UPI0005F45C59|nr:PREDICTED: uncharacterized protein LOC105556809 [Vollenhovia emeryi]
MGQDPRNHDCRRNFWGSAKAMEPHVAKNLVNSSEVLKSQNLQVGVLIGDDDSSTIAACRSTSSHPIVKFSDKNHASGGVTKELYKIANNRKHRELTKDGIMYLHRCFTYAMSTNKGDSEGMAKTIRCIPYHAFNDHNQCGDWCGYLSDPENYDHSMIPGGFHDQELFKHLKDLFDRLASNSQKFSPGASSNANESLHASMASVAPKSRCYSLTASSDYRFALTVGHKNEGPQFMQNVLKSAGLSPGKHFSKHIAKTQRVLQRRRILTKAPEYKKRRLALKKLRTALRHRKENVEGITYQSNCTLLDKPEEDRNNKTVQHTSSDEENNDESNPLIVLLDLETSGLNRDCDILQIAAKCGRASFSTYINPKKQISAAVTEANGLTNFQGVLLYHGLAVKSVTLRLAMSELHLWLSARSTPPYIATHNLSFDGSRFHDAIVSCNLQEEFQQVVRGFIDTLTVIRKVTERKKKGECSISGLANWLNIPTEGAHNAENDVRILQKILRSAKITHQNLIDSAKTWDEQTGIWIRDRDANRFLSNLAPLKGIVGDTIRKKLAYASITIDSLQQIFHDSGIPGIVQILTEKINGKPRVTSHKPSVEKITKWVEQNLNLNSRETPSSA